MESPQQKPISLEGDALVSYCVAVEILARCLKDELCTYRCSHAVSQDRAAKFERRRACDSKNGMLREK